MRASVAVAMLLAVLLTGSLASGEVTPGFQCTVNNYVVSMDETPASCRQQNVGCSKHMNFHFKACGGRVDIPFEMTNDDALHGFCGSVRIVARDRAGNPPGNVLLDVQSGYYCIDAKGEDTDFHERVGHVDWSFQADPTVGNDGHDLVMQITQYDESIKWAELLPIKIIGFIKMLALPSIG